MGRRLPHFGLKVFGQWRPIIDHHQLTGRNGLSPYAFQTLLQIVRSSGREQKNGNGVQLGKDSGWAVKCPGRQIFFKRSKAFCHRVLLPSSFW